MLILVSFKFLFVRALKKVLSFDNGSVFMYAKHENSILNAIRNQLKDQMKKTNKINSVY